MLNDISSSLQLNIFNKKKLRQAESRKLESLVVDTNSFFDSVQHNKIMSFRISIIISFGIIFLSFLQAQTQLHTPNFRIFPSPLAQTEPVITVSPVNPNLLFASAFTINTSTSFSSEGVYVSTDGGDHWFGNDTCKGELLTNHGGDPGVMIDSTGRLILSHIGSAFPGVYTHYSTDLGATWSSSQTITYEQPDDKGAVTIDNTPQSPYYGRVYLAWVSIQDPSRVLNSFSSNSGSSWATGSAINNAPSSRCSGGSLTTSRSGNVYSCWAVMTQSFPIKEDYAGFSVSANGGDTWTATENIFDMNGITGTLPSKNNIRVNGIPQIEIDNSGGINDGNLYIVTNEKNISPAGSDPDIILHRSTNGGATWSNGIRVNQDTLNNGKIQYFPALAIDKDGGLNIIYMDDRFTSSDSTEVMLARSTDAGTTWREYVISEHRFKPKSIPQMASGVQGDRIALLANEDHLQAFWMDDYSGTYQIWSCQIDLQVLGVNETNPLPTIFSLEQNYPNPFNPVTTIRYNIPLVGTRLAVSSLGLSVQLKIYNLLGKEVATLVDEMQDAGYKSVTWDASKMPSGIYFYRLLTPTYSQIKTMMLVK